MSEGGLRQQTVALECEVARLEALLDRTTEEPSRIERRRRSSVPDVEL